MTAAAAKAYEMRSGMECLEALDKASRGVEAASTELARLIQEFGEAHLSDDGEIVMGVGLQFESALREEKAALYEQAILAGKRPPPEDIREAIAQRKVQVKDPALWAKFHAMKSRIDNLRSWIGNQKAVISAQQSIRKGEVA